jgi:hypothetical protein
MEVATSSDGSVHHVLDLLRVGNIYAQSKSLETPFAKFRCFMLCGRTIFVGDHDLGATGSEGTPDSSPYSTRAPCDQCDLSRKGRREER